MPKVASKIKSATPSPYVVDASDIAETAEAKVFKATERDRLWLAAVAVSSWQQPGYTVEDGVYYNISTGVKTTLVGYRALKMPLTGAEIKLRASASVSGDATALAVYFDAAGNVLSLQNQGPASGAVSYSAFELTVPELARAVAITGQASQPIKLEILVPRAVSDNLDAVQAAGVATAKVANAAFDVMKSWSQPAYTVEAGVYYNRTTGMKTTLNGYQALKVALAGTELKLRATASVAGPATSLAIYYDAGGAVIGTQNQGPASGADQYTAFELTVPELARAVAITGQSSQPIKLEILAPRQVSADLDTALATGTANAAAIAANTKSATTALNTVTSWKTPTYAVEQGAYYKALTGAKVTNATYQTAVIPLTGSELALRASGTTTGSDTALAVYYDGAGAYLSYEFMGSNAGNTVYANQALTPPAAARSVAITGRANASMSFQILTARDLAAVETKADKGAVAATALTAWKDSGAAVVAGFYISNTGVATPLNGYSYLDYMIDGAELAFRATGRESGGATALATYIDQNGTALGREFAGTGSNVDYVDQVLTVPAGTVKIRLCGVTSSPLALRTQKVMTDAAQQILDLKAGLGTVRPLAVVGDSTAAMIAPVLAALYPGRTTYAQGMGGQTTAQTAARLGAKQVTLGAFTIPTSGSVAVTPSIDLLFLSGRPNAASCRIMVLGVPFNLVCAASTGAYTLTPTVYPASALNVPAGTPLQVISGVSQTTDPSTAPPLDAILASIVVARASRNDTSLMTSQAGRDAVIADMAAILDQVASRGGRPMLCTGINGNYDLPTGTATGAAVADAVISASRLAGIAALNAAMLARWPDRVIDVQANHVARGGSTSRTVNGQTFDVLDQPTLNADGLHESTATGLPRTGALLKSHIDGRGW